MEGAGYSWGCVRWLLSHLLPPASTTEELKSIFSIDFLHANLISHQQKDLLETFLKREALMLCLSKMLQTLWECWADCAGGVFVSKSARLYCPIALCFADTGCFLCPQHAQYAPGFVTQTFLTVLYQDMGGNISLILVHPNLDRIFPLPAFPCSTGGWGQVLHVLDQAQHSCARFE